MECHVDSPIYDEIMEECNELEPVILKLVQPKAVLAFTIIDEEYEKNLLPLGSPVLYAISTVGNLVSELSNDYFSEGEYVKGMLTDIMADVCLFSLEEELQARIRALCEEQNIGIRHRYEAPTDVPMVVQKIAYEKTKAKENLGITITSGFMLNPVKSNCQVFGISEDPKQFQLEHDCRSCSQYACPIRNVPPVILQVTSSKNNRQIMCKEDETILESLIRNGIYFSAVCGGRGTCGKCKIQVLEGHIERTKADVQFFSQEELECGYRLACRAIPKENCIIQIEEQETDGFEILSDYKQQDQKVIVKQNAEYKIAVDIGTTTIAISLVEAGSRQSIYTYTAINQQRSYGADVINRIQASNDGKREALQTSIQGDLWKGLQDIIKQCNIKAEQIQEIAIAGNTTMGHLLLGFDCKTLGEFPFKPVEIGFIEKSGRQLFENMELSKTIITLLPGISTFVGGDIVSGLYYCGFHENEKICLLIDLGTNGEMAIGNNEKILTTSTAAGPAFEGGNITWGTGSIQGAICNVDLQSEPFNILTIGNKAPIGICGTGVIELTAELLKEELIDETGLLEEPYFEHGFVLAKTDGGEELVFTQKDIREIQLAKAAIRAGVETLIKRYNINYGQIDNVYLAGGFGFKMNVEKAIAIGMFPQEFSGKIEAIGNSSLGGAVKYLGEANAKEELARLINISSEINLSNDKDFNEYYMNHMFFE